MKNVNNLTGIFGTPLRRGQVVLLLGRSGDRTTKELAVIVGFSPKMVRVVSNGRWQSSERSYTKNPDTILPLDERNFAIMSDDFAKKAAYLESICKNFNHDGKYIGG